MGKPLLTIETLAPDRPTIEIDGVEYELALPADFSIRDEAENARLLRKGTEMLNRAQADTSHEISPEVQADLEELLGGVVDVVLKAPPAIKAKLRWRHQLAIIQAFGPAVAMAAPTPPPSRTNSRSTSATSPRASRRRTALATGSESRAASSSR